VVLEKTEYYGGSTAISGGGIWIPANHLMAEAGIADSVENARTYAPFLPAVVGVVVRNLCGKATRARHVAAGAALIARLRMSLHENGVPVRLNTSVTGLLFSDGSTIGVEARKDGKQIRIRAAKGVVLASGGFPRNEAMRRKYQKPPVSAEWTAAAAGNTGLSTRESSRTSRAMVVSMCASLT